MFKSVVINKVVYENIVEFVADLLMEVALDHGSVDVVGFDIRGLGKVGRVFVMDDTLLHGAVF